MVRPSLSTLSSIQSSLTQLSSQCFSSVTAAFSYLPVALFLPQYSASVTSSVTQQNLVLAIFNLVAAIGSAASGVLSDISYAYTCIFCGAAGAIICFTAWGLADSLAKVYAFAVLFALTGQMVSYVHFLNDRGCVLLTTFFTMSLFRAWSGASRDVARSNPNTSALALTLFSVARGIASIILPFLADKLYQPAKAEQGCVHPLAGNTHH
jgi:MFS family permease